LLYFVYASPTVTRKLSVILCVFVRRFIHGVKRHASSFNTQRIDHLYQDQHEANVNFKLHYDLTDSTNIIQLYRSTAG
jgi:GDP-D-mannose dehydratase